MKIIMNFISTLLVVLILCMATYAQSVDPILTGAGECIVIEPTADELLQRLQGLDRPTYHLLIEPNSDWEVTSLYSASDRLGRVMLHNIKTDEWMTLSPGSTSNGISVVSIADDKNFIDFLVGTNEVHWSLGAPDKEKNEEFEQGGPGYPPQGVGSPDP